MTKTVRLNKANSLKELDAHIEWGMALSQRAVDDQVAFADVMVERLEWQASVLKLLPRIAKGIEAVSDFTRSAGRGVAGLEPPLSEDVLQFRKGMRAQIESLERARERVRKLGTRQLAT